MNRKVASMVAVVLMLGVASCGESEPTKAEFAKAADGVCQSYRTRITKVMTPSDGTSGATAELATQGLELRHEMVDELAGVETPGNLDAVYARYLTTLRSIDSLTEQFIAAAPAGSDGSAEPGSEMARIGEQQSGLAHVAGPLAKRLGLKVCTA